MQSATTRFPKIVAKLYLIASLAIFSTGMLSGCTGGNYGRIQGSNEVTDLFEIRQILPDHTYYYNGFQAIPYVIVGIHNQYHLRSSVWHRVKLTPALLNQLTTRMQSVYSGSPKGARIIGPNNERLGIWYSTERQTAVRLRQENRIVIAPPQSPDMRGIP